jgi:hypothetical protein
MAHIAKAVVVVCVDGKPLRGYNHQKNGNTVYEDVYMPFGSEYSVHFKFQDGRRYRLEMSIDGTKVTDDLIVCGEAELERFVETARKFKFVRATDGAVSDPTSSDNGKMVITLYPEKSWSHCDFRLSGGYNGSGNTHSPLRSMSFDSPQWVTCCAQSGPTTGSISASTINTSTIMTGNIAEKGATVEGGCSNQKFSPTVWRGDDVDSLCFVFSLYGKNPVQDRIHELEAELAMLKHLMGPGISVGW